MVNCDYAWTCDLDFKRNLRTIYSDWWFHMNDFDSGKSLLATFPALSGPSRRKATIPVVKERCVMSQWKKGYGRRNSLAHTIVKRMTAPWTPSCMKRCVVWGGLSCRLKDNRDEPYQIRRADRGWHAISIVAHAIAWYRMLQLCKSRRQSQPLHFRAQNTRSHVIIIDNY